MEHLQESMDTSGRDSSCAENAVAYQDFLGVQRKQVELSQI